MLVVPLLDAICTLSLNVRTKHSIGIDGGLYLVQELTVKRSLKCLGS